MFEQMHSSPLRIWIIKVGELLPIDSNTRPMRSGILSQILAERGHQVTYWASTFSHFGKKHIFRKQQLFLGDPAYSLSLLHGPGYKTNVSLKRMLNHWVEAKDFWNRAHLEARPDILVCSMPTIDLCHMAVRFGKLHDVPVIIDVRDKWPEVFIMRASPRLRPVLRILLSPLTRKVRRIFQDATGITGVSRQFVDWAATLGGRPLQELDRVFPLAFNPPDVDPNRARQAVAYWDAQGVTTEHGRLILGYVGSLSRRASGELLRFTKLLSECPEIAARWRLVICGDGELATELRAFKSPNVHLPGWVGQAEIHELLARASAGIIPYPDQPDLLASNKFAEYLSAGLPIISHFGGEIGEALERERCGWIYRSDRDVRRILNEIFVDPDEQRRRRTRAKSLYDREFQATVVYEAFARHVEKAALAGRASNSAAQGRDAAPAAISGQ